MDQDATGTEVGLGPGYIVLDGDSAPSPRKGAQHCGQAVAHLSNYTELLLKEIRQSPATGY